MGLKESHQGRIGIPNQGRNEQEQQDAHGKCHKKVNASKEAHFMPRGTQQNKPVEEKPSGSLPWSNYLWRWSSEAAGQYLQLTTVD